MTFEAKVGETFYCQGDLSEKTELPWTVSVAYYLDGNEVSADELGGATGDLKMVLSIAPIEAGEDTSDEEQRLASYADAYLLQASASSDADHITRVQFVIKTDGISKPDEGDDTDADTEDDQAAQSFIDKLVALFK